MLEEERAAGARGPLEHSVEARRCRRGTSRTRAASSRRTLDELLGFRAPRHALALELRVRLARLRDPELGRVQVAPRRSQRSLRLQPLLLLLGALERAARPPAARRSRELTRLGGGALVGGALGERRRQRSEERRAASQRRTRSSSTSACNRSTPASARATSASRRSSSSANVSSDSIEVPGTGLEPVWPKGHPILSRARLTSFATPARRAYRPCGKVRAVTHDTIVILAVLGVVGQVLAAVLIVSALAALAGLRGPLRASGRLLWGYELWAAFVVAAIATGGSLFFSEIAHFVPCELCWYQRICMYPLSILTLFLAVHGDHRVARYLLPLPVVGAGVSIYHLLIENKVDRPSRRSA